MHVHLIIKMIILLKKCPAMKRTVYILLALALANAVSAQEIRLTNRFVTDVAVDSLSRAWVATEEGLNCYDGIRTITLQKRPGGLPSNQINRLLLDGGSQKIWVATQKAGLACYEMETGNVRVYTADGSEGSLPDNDVSDVEQAPDGSIWAATFSKGLARLDESTGQFTIYTKDTFEGMRDVPLHIFKVLGDRLLLGYWEGGVSILSLTDHSRTDFRFSEGNPSGLPSDEVRSLLVDSHGRIWVGTTAGLALYTGAGDKFVIFRHESGNTRSLPDGTVWDLAEDARGRLLVASGSGEVAALDISRTGMIPSDAPFEMLTSGLGAHEPAVRALCPDKFGNIWVGTYGNGMSLLTDRTWGAGIIGQTYAGQDSREVSALACSRDGSLVAGYRSGLILEPYGKGIWDNAEGESGRGAVLALMEDAQGRWWIGMENVGLAIRDKDRTRKIVFDRPDISVQSLLEDGKQVWAGTDRGLYCIDKQTLGIIRHWTHRTGEIPDDLVQTLLKDSNGMLWVGTFGHGLAIFDSSLSPVAQYDANSGLLSDTVNHLMEDSAGRIWVATPSGVVRFDGNPDEIAAVYNSENRLSDENIRSVVEDSYGNLWLSRYDGVTCMAPNGNTAFYDMRDGLPDGNYFVSSAAITPDGRLWFGTTDGIGWINPKVLLEKVELPPVEFLSSPGELSTDYRNNSMTVRFCVPDHSLGGRVDYSYRIPADDMDWTDCGPELEFRRLPYGRHKLQVRARIHSQEWDDSWSETTITVKPPFWMTWWAFIIYALLLAAGVWMYTRRQIKRADRKNEEKMLRERIMQERQMNDERMVFFTNVAHELRTPLTLILGPLEDMSRDEGIPSKSKAMLGKIKTSAQRLQSLVNQLLEFRKTESGCRELLVRFGDLSQLVETVSQLYQDLSSKPGVEFRRDIDPGITLWHDEEAVNIILSNLLSNAWKFTSSGEITVSLKDEGDKVALKVADTGCGMDEESLQNIFRRYYQVNGPKKSSGTGIGLALVKNLCDLHGIDLSVKSEPGKGSEFTLLLNPRETYPNAQHAALESAETPQSEPEPHEESQGIKVLVVEDNADIREYIKDCLEGEYSVSMATQGREGLKEAVREMPDIIVSDIMMPEMDGIAMLRAIRQDVYTSHIPVILLTAKGTDEDRLEGYEVGADSYLVKPFNKALLLGRIRNLLERQSRLMKQVSQTGTSAGLSPMDNEFLRRYTEFVHEHMTDEKIDTASLAGQFAMSQSTLYRKVKAVSGLSPNELIRNIRLSRAAELLVSNSSLSIAEIGWQTGFSTAVYFRTCFKERYGVTPSEYRSRKAEK